MTRMAGARGSGGSRSGGSSFSSRSSSGGSSSGRGSLDFGRQCGDGHEKDTEYCSSSKSSPFALIIDCVDDNVPEHKKQQVLNLGCTYSSRLFADSKRHYYYSRGKKQYVYVSEDLSTFDYSKYRKFRYSVAGFLKNNICFIFLFIFTIVCICGVIWLTLDKPNKFEANKASTVYIRDNLGVIDNIDAVTDSALKFREAIGLTPAILTVDTAVWDGKWDSLETYSLEQYYSMFRDEYHILFVYSLPVGEEFENWEWIAIYGDNSLSCYSDKRVRYLNDIVQNGLYTGEVGYAFEHSFNEAVNEYQNTYWTSSSTLVASVLGFIPFVMMLVVLIGTFLYHRKRNTAFEFLDGLVLEQPLKCEFCTGVYYIGEKTCPHCGAPVKIENR